MNIYCLASMTVTLPDWLDPEILAASLLSAAVLIVGFFIYHIFQKRILAPAVSEQNRRWRDSLVLLGIILLMLVSLMQIWHSHIAFLDDIHSYLKTSSDPTDWSLYAKIIWTLVTATAMYILAHAAQHGLVRKAEDIETRHKIRRTIVRVGIVLFFFIAIPIWIPGTALLNSIGIFGAGLALAMHEMLLCLAGWGLISIQKPFDIGDRIEVNGHIGDVIDIRLFQTSLLEVGNWVHADQSTGRLLHVPNSMLFRHVASNYTRGFPFIWNEVEVVITFESDWERAKKIIFRQASEEADKIEGQVRQQLTMMQSQYAIRYEHLRPIVYTDVVGNGVRLSLRYLSPVRERRATIHRIWECILREFSHEDSIDFAYATTRIYRNNEEGKAGNGGPLEPLPPLRRYYSALPPEDPESKEPSGKVVEEGRGIVKRRPLVVLVTGVVAGVLAQRSNNIPLTLLVPFLLALGATVWLLLRQRQRMIGVLLLATAIASALGTLRSYSMRQQSINWRLAIPPGEVKELRLKIAESSVIPPEKLRLHAENTRLRLLATVVSEGTSKGASVLLYTDTSEPEFLPVPGSVVEVDGEVWSARPPAFDGGFSLTAYQERLGACAALGVQSIRKVEDAPRWSVQAMLFRLRQRCVENILTLLPDQRGLVLAAVLFGYREGLTPEMRRPFSRTGTGHLLAISGLHVGLVAGLAWFFFRRLKFGTRASAVGTIVICLLYLGISGGRPSAVRAAVMACVYLGGFLVYRRSDLINSLACAAIILLFINPAVITDAGFLLSFTAVIFLSRLGHELHILRPQDSLTSTRHPEDMPLLQRGSHKLARYGWGLFLLALAAWIGLWPLSAYYFHLVTPASLILNVITIPWLSVVLVGGILTLLVSVMPAGVALAAAKVTSWPTAILLEITRTVDSNIDLAFPVNPPEPGAMLLYYAVFLLFFARRTLHLRGWNFVPAFIIATAFIINSMSATSPSEQNRLALLPSGFSHFAVIEDSDGKVLMVGSFPQGGMDGADYLRTRHYSRLDGVVQFLPRTPDQDDNLHILREQYGDFPLRTVSVYEPNAASDSVPLPAELGGSVRLMRNSQGWLEAWLLNLWSRKIIVTRTRRIYSTVRLLSQTVPGKIDILLFNMGVQKWPESLLVADHDLYLKPWKMLPEVRLNTERVLVNYGVQDCPSGITELPASGSLRMTWQKSGELQVQSYETDKGWQ